MTTAIVTYSVTEAEIAVMREQCATLSCETAEGWLVGVMGKLGAAVELCEDFAGAGAEVAA